jgi:hypothetical protein
MSWYLCTIAATSKRNWELCLDSKTWGISTQSGFASKDMAREGDYLLFWLAKIGFVGFAEVAADTRPPVSSGEVPWLGGATKYGLVVPLKNINQFNPPIKLNFEGRTQEKTKLDQYMFQRGYMPIPDEAANSVVALQS